MELYVVRHGQTDWNVENKVQGKADISLNNKGLEQAEETREQLKTKQFDIIICSPLKRARETAQVINRDRNLQIIYDDQISERDFGEFEGVYKKDFDFEGFWSYKQNVHFQKAENIRDFFNRIYLWLDKTKSEYKDKNILLVTHAGVSIPIECYSKGIPNQDSLLNLSSRNCEIRNYCFEKEKV